MKSKHTDNDYIGYADHMVSVKATGKTTLLRIGIILVFLAIAIAGAVLLASTMPTVIAFVEIAVVFLGWFVFQFTKVEYEYVIEAGVMTLDRVYGSRIRKKAKVIKVTDMIAVKTGEGVSDKSADLIACNENDSHAGIITYTENGREKTIRVSLPEKTLRCIRFYNKGAFEENTAR